MVLTAASQCVLLLQPKAEKERREKGQGSSQVSTKGRVLGSTFSVVILAETLDRFHVVIG